MATETLPVYTKKDFQTDQEIRWCPGCGDYAILSAVQSVFAELGSPPRKFRVHFRHRLLQPLPVLHEDVRLPHHPRARAGHRHGPENHAPRSRRLGRDRRRRFAFDRRQSHHSHAAPQCRAESSALQQSASTDLPRANIRPRPKSARRRNPLRSAPPTARSIPFLWRSAPKPPSSRVPWTFSSST